MRSCSPGFCSSPMMAKLKTGHPHANEGRRTSVRSIWGILPTERPVPTIGDVWQSVSSPSSDKLERSLHRPCLSRGNDRGRLSMICPILIDNSTSTVTASPINRIRLRRYGAGKSLRSDSPNNLRAGWRLKEITPWRRPSQAEGIKWIRDLSEGASTGSRAQADTPVIRAIATADVSPVLPGCNP